MLTIRLRRTGAKKDPHYRVVVADRAASRDGAFLEILGHYHPRQQPAEIVLNLERTEVWLGQGARMSDTVRTLYRRVRSGRVEQVPEVAEAPPAATPSDSELEAAAEVEVAAEAEVSAVTEVVETEADADVEVEAEAQAEAEAATEAPDTDAAVSPADDADEGTPEKD